MAFAVLLTYSRGLAPPDHTHSKPALCRPEIISAVTQSAAASLACSCTEAAAIPVHSSRQDLGPLLLPPSKALLQAAQRSPCSCLPQRLHRARQRGAPAGSCTEAAGPFLCSGSLDCEARWSSKLAVMNQPWWLDSQYGRGWVGCTTNLPTT